MKKHASRPSAKPFSQEIHEKTPCGRQMHNANKCTETCWKMIPANASRSGKPCGRLRITSGQGRHPAEQASRDKGKEIGKWSCQNPANNHLGPSGRQMKGNWRRHLSQGQGIQQSKSPKASSTAIRVPSNPSQAKLFLIKTWGSIGARFKPWSSLDLFRQPRSWILPQSSAWDFSPGGSGKRSNDFWQPCFTRMTSTKKSEIWSFQKK